MPVFRPESKIKYKLVFGMKAQYKRHCTTGWVGLLFSPTKPAQPELLQSPTKTGRARWPLQHQLQMPRYLVVSLSSEVIPPPLL